jgi:hypothetical protein
VILAWLMRPVVGLILMALGLAAVLAAASEYAGMYAIPRAAVLWVLVALAASVLLLREPRS